jgi:1-deoxy-D-xylulose-5-phosphate synthase
VGVALPKKGTPLAIGKGRILREGASIAIFSLGTRLAECLKAAERFQSYGLSATVADARFAKPLDTDLLRRLVRNHEVVLTVEEGSAGGFGAHVLHYLAHAGELDRGLKIRTLMLPDRFIDQDAPERMYEAASLDANAILAAGLNALGRANDAARLA